MTYGGSLQLVRLGGVALTREHRKRLARCENPRKISPRRLGALENPRKILPRRLRKTLGANHTEVPALNGSGKNHSRFRKAPLAEVGQTGAPISWITPTGRAAHKVEFKLLAPASPKGTKIPTCRDPRPWE